MKKIHLPISFIFSGYGSLLLLLAFFFLMQDNSLHNLKGDFPLPFIMRFCTFWFISFVLALLFYLVRLQSTYFSATSADQHKARLLGLLAIGLAALSTVVTVAVIYLY